MVGFPGCHSFDLAVIHAGTGDMSDISSHAKPGAQGRNTKSLGIFVGEWLTSKFKHRHAIDAQISKAIVHTIATRIEYPEFVTAILCQTGIFEIDTHWLCVRPSGKQDISLTINDFPGAFLRIVVWRENDVNELIVRIDIKTAGLSIICRDFIWSLSIYIGNIQNYCIYPFSIRNKQGTNSLSP